jgi:hypothetical protein
MLSPDQLLQAFKRVQEQQFKRNKSYKRGCVLSIYWKTEDISNEVECKFMSKKFEDNFGFKATLLALDPNNSSLANKLKLEILIYRVREEVLKDRAHGLLIIYYTGYSCIYNDVLYLVLNSSIDMSEIENTIGMYDPAPFFEYGFIEEYIDVIFHHLVFLNGSTGSFAFGKGKSTGYSVLSARVSFVESLCDILDEIPSGGWSIQEVHQTLSEMKSMRPVPHLFHNLGPPIFLFGRGTSVPKRNEMPPSVTVTLVFEEHFDREQALAFAQQLNKLARMYNIQVTVRRIFNDDLYRGHVELDSSVIVFDLINQVSPKNVKVYSFQYDICSPSRWHTPNLLSIERFCDVVVCTRD